jgi:Domain of unknown function (DUF4349)
MNLRASVLASLLAIALVACGPGGDAAYERGEAAGGADVASPAPAETPPSVGYGRDADGVASGVDQGTAAPGQQQPALPGAADTARADSAAAAIPRMIIRTGTATVEVDSLEVAIARVNQLAARLGGFVANTQVQTGDRQTREATLEMKIPAAQWDRAVSGLAPIGEREALNVTAQDVGEEFVDASARLANARRLETRLLELLENRTGRLEDVLAVERELARVRGEIERVEGRLRYLRSRVAVSTLTVTLHEAYPVVGDYPGANPILRAFREAWRNFVNFLAGFISSLGVLIPLLVILWIGWKVLRWMFGGRGGGGGGAAGWRFWERRPPPPPPAPPASTPPPPVPPAGD